MLSKCANPPCPNVFRYLHEGRLFLIDYASGASGRDRSTIGSAGPEYAWLCSSCCRDLTIRIDRRLGVIVDYKSEITGPPSKPELLVDGDSGAHPPSFNF